MFPGVPVAPGCSRGLAVALAKEHWLALVGVTALSPSGQFLMSWSYARAEAQYLIPTEYSAFVWAILFGWVFFDEGVVWTTLIGALLIIVGCLIAARSAEMRRTSQGRDP